MEASKAPSGPDLNLILDEFRKLEIKISTKISSLAFTKASQTIVNTLFSCEGIHPLSVNAEEDGEFGELSPTLDILPFKWSNGVTDWTENQATPLVMKYLDPLLLGKGVTIHDSRFNVKLKCSMKLPEGGIQCFRGHPDIVLADADKAMDIFPATILFNSLLDIELKTPKAFLERSFIPQAVLKALSFANTLKRPVFVFVSDFVSGMSIYCIKGVNLKLYKYKNDAIIPLDIAMTIMYKVIEAQRVILNKVVKDNYNLKLSFPDNEDMDDGSEMDSNPSDYEPFKCNSKPSLSISLSTRSRNGEEKIGNDEYQHSYATLKQMQVRQQVVNSKAFQLMFPNCQIGFEE